MDTVDCGQYRSELKEKLILNFQLEICEFVAKFIEGSREDSVCILLF